MDKKSKLQQELEVKQQTKIVLKDDKDNCAKKPEQDGADKILGEQQGSSDRSEEIIDQEN